MNGERGDDSRAADQRNTARHVLRSVLAGMAGMAVAGVWVWLLIEVLHPAFPALFVGIPVLYTTM
jgi:Flp pilus assembly protein TadB